MIITRTPFRISFFGGGTDYPPWFRKNGGSVLATTIDKYCYITCRHLPPFFEHKHRIVYSVIESVRELDQIKHPAVREVLRWAAINSGLEIHHDGDLPARSGLGSSSAFTVGLINALAALEGRIVSKEKLAMDSIHIEQNIIQENVGSQDQISASYGGFNKIKFNQDDSFDVQPIILDHSRKVELESHLMLFFTGLSRIASEVAAAKIANLDKREFELNRMHRMVDESIKILQEHQIPIEEFGYLLDQSWKLKRALSDKVSSQMIDALYAKAIEAGALGGKILGAGGGGFLLLFVKPERQAEVKAALNDLVYVPFKFENSGSKVVLYQPNGL